MSFRVMMKVSVPNEYANAAIREGTFGRTMHRVLEEIKPEAAYFCEDNGLRTAFLFVNVNHVHEIPKIAEPAFLGLNAKVEMRIAMNGEDLAKANLETIGKSW